MLHSSLFARTLNATQMKQLNTESGGIGVRNIGIPVRWALEGWRPRSSKRNASICMQSAGTLGRETEVICKWQPHLALIQNIEGYSSPCPNWLRWQGLPLKLRLLYNRADLVQRWARVIPLALLSWIYMNYQWKAETSNVFFSTFILCDFTFFYVLYKYCIHWRTVGKIRAQR